MFGVCLAVRRALLVFVLCEGPVDGLYLLLCGGAVAFVWGIVHGYVACGDDEVAVGGYFVEELIVFPRRVGACSVAPYEHREGIVLGEGRETLWNDDSVSLEAG